MLAALALAAVCLMPPVDGPVAARFEPTGPYSGHFGVDYAVPVGTAVLAPVSGRVTFAGLVAGMRTMTIEPVPGFKVSLSYLETLQVTQGRLVERADPVATAGAPHGRPGVHLSTRSDGRYVDPLDQMGCRGTDITRALRLVTPPRPYPRSRAYRDPRRNLRPDPHRPSPRGGVCTRPAGSRPGALHARRRSLAEAGDPGIAWSPPAGNDPDRGLRGPRVRG